MTRLLFGLAGFGLGTMFTRMPITYTHLLAMMCGVALACAVWIVALFPPEEIP